MACQAIGNESVNPFMLQDHIIARRGGDGHKFIAGAKLKIEMLRQPCIACQKTRGYVMALREDRLIALFLIKRLMRDKGRFINLVGGVMAGG